MAKITIVVEDTPTGRVQVVCTPSFQIMMQMQVSGAGLTSAHGYALTALNSIMKESKSKCPTKILIPRVKRQ